MGKIARTLLFVAFSGVCSLLASGSALAQKAALVQSTDDPARTPYQQFMIFNQGPATCTAFACTVTFPAVPAGKRLVVTYVSAHFGAPGGSATVVLQSSSSVLGIYLPLPQTYGFNTYVGAGPVTLFVDAGSSPTVVLGGVNLSSSSTSAQVALVGHLVTLP